MKNLIQIVFISIFCSILFLFPVKAENFNPIEVHLHTNGTYN